MANTPPDEPAFSAAAAAVARCGSRGVAGVGEVWSTGRLSGLSPSMTSGWIAGHAMTGE